MTIDETGAGARRVRLELQPSLRNLGVGDDAFVVIGNMPAGSHLSAGYGNADRSVWTDLAHEVEAPPAARDPDGVVSFDRPELGTRLAIVRPVQKTPFAMSIEFSEAAVLAPAVWFLRILIAIAALCIAVGAAVAWALSGRVTGRLQQLTSAAEAIASGERVEWQPDSSAHDEIGQLMRSFGAMARQIGQPARPVLDGRRSLLEPVHRNALAIR